MPTLATWNVNSIRARHDRVVAWTAKHRPDILCLQETKVEDARFPGDALAGLGYQLTLNGQKTYNGVAILSRAPASEVVRGLGDDVDDPQQRLLAATIEGIRVVCVYAPNGGELGSDKFRYKLAWYARLLAWLGRQARTDQPLALCGDFNVAPEARDVKLPEKWEREVLFHPDARAALASITGWGVADAYRMCVEDAGMYSWWDYRAGSLRKDDGLRIDHVLVTPPLAARVRGAFIDRDEREPRDGSENPSDHAPVVVTLG